MIPHGKGQVGYTPLDIRPGAPLLVTSGNDLWRPAQTCSFGSLGVTSGGGQ